MVAGIARSTRDAAMTFVELGILLTSAGASAAGCAALFGAVLDRIAKEPTPRPIALPQRVQGTVRH